MGKENVVAPLNEKKLERRNQAFIRFMEESNPYQTFVKKYVISIIRDEDAGEDVMQNIWIRTLRHAESLYTENFSEIGRRQRMLQVARNESINYLKRLNNPIRGGGKVGSLTSQEYKIADISPTPEDAVVKHDLYVKSLNILPEEFRVVANLYMQGYLTKEIGEKLSVPIGTVLSRIYRAKRKLNTDILIKDFPGSMSGKNCKND